MENRRNDDYINDRANLERSGTDGGYLKPKHVNNKDRDDNGYVELGHMNNQNIGSSVKYDIIDYDLLNKNDPRQDRHTYRGLKFESKKGNKTDNTLSHRSEKVEITSTAEQKKGGNRVLILIIVLLVVLLIAMAATFGVLYTGGFFDKDGTTRTAEKTLSSAAITTTKITETTSTAKTSPATTTLPRTTTARTAEKTLSSAAITTTKITETTSTAKTSPATTTLPRTTTEPLSLDERCQVYDGLIPHSGQCQAYFNCSDTHEYPAMHNFYKYLKECDYPQLFNTETMACENFEKVDCGDREEFKDGCSYIVNQCVRQCRLCEIDIPSCIGKDDGPSMHKYKPWSPIYIICYKERFMAELSCPTGELFSPEYNFCVTPALIPPEHGGYKPNCTGKEDGFYSNNMGNCDLYEICSSGAYAGPGHCYPDKEFDEISKTCKDATSAFTCECSGNC